MRLRWTAAAAGDLEHIADYLFEKSPEHAERLLRTIFDRITGLKTYPNRGRVGKKPRTRELVISSLPYVVIYEVKGDALHVVRICTPHSSGLFEARPGQFIAGGSDQSCIRRSCPKE
jgi:toxin ParE1/3/4